MVYSSTGRVNFFIRSIDFLTNMNISESSAAEVSVSTESSIVESSAAEVSVSTESSIVEHSESTKSSVAEHTETESSVDKVSGVTIMDSSEVDDIEFIRRHMNGKDVTEWLEELMQPRESQASAETSETSNDSLKTTENTTDTEEVENLEIDLTKPKNRAARRREAKQVKKGSNKTANSTKRARCTKLRAKKPKSNVISE